MSPSPFQAIISASAFSIGILCDDEEIHAIHYLKPCPELCTKNPLAIEAANQIRAYLSDPDFHFLLPLRISGTTFQRRVWHEVEKIPNRETRTYGEIAKLLHNAPRAVGQACGANFFPLVIPCHRVIAAGNKLGGFGGAKKSADENFLLNIKRWLLAHEHART